MLHKKSISLCGNNSEIEKNLFQISNSEQKELTEDTEVFSEENEVSSAVLVNSIQLDVEEFPQIRIEISDICKKPKKLLFEDFNAWAGHKTTQQTHRHPVTEEQQHSNLK